MLKFDGQRVFWAPEGNMQDKKESGGTNAGGGLISDTAKAGGVGASARGPSPTVGRTVPGSTDDVATQTGAPGGTDVAGGTGTQPE